QPRRRAAQGCRAIVASYETGMGAVRLRSRGEARSLRRGPAPVSAPRQRFYRDVAVGPQSGAGYPILLDGKPVRTPAGHSLVLKGRKVAEAVADEWRAQGGKIDPAKMMLTKLANTAIDRVAPDRAEAVRQIVAFGRSDLLCYRAQAPIDLVERQDSVWGPLLD